MGHPYVTIIWSNISLGSIDAFHLVRAECILDAIVEVVEDFTSYILIRLPIIFLVLEACVSGCLFCPPYGWLGLVCWHSPCIKDWISLCVDNGNLCRIINRKWSRVRWETEW